MPRLTCEDTSSESDAAPKRRVRRRTARVARAPDPIPELCASSNEGSDKEDSDDEFVSCLGDGDTEFGFSDDDEPLDYHDVLIDYLKHLLFMRTLTASHFCTIMYYLGKAGSVKCRKLGLRPTSSTGHFQRKADRQFGDDKNRPFYELTVPGRSRSAIGRDVTILPMYPLHEIVDNDMRANPSFKIQLEEAVEAHELPEAYFKHPVVMQYGGSELVAPYGVFIDGVPYSRRDSCIGFWYMNLITQTRTLWCSIRKVACCTCGCRGWCSYHAIFRCMQWSIEALARRVHPTARDDGSQWSVFSDLHRADQSGNGLEVRAVLLYIKGDWAEYCHTLGMPMWSDSLRCCFKCNADLDNRFNIYGITPSSCGEFCENADEDYELACLRCETMIVIDRSTHRRLLDLLYYDKKDDGCHGLVVDRPGIPEANIGPRMRIEPSPFTPDVADIFALDVFPWPVLLWNCDKQTLTKHRNPIFTPHTGVSVQRSCTIDGLHCLYLGVFNSLACHVLWELIMARAFSGASTQDELLANSATIIKMKLRNFYRDWKRLHPCQTLTEVSDLTAGMLGEPSSRKLASKGAETWGVILFLIRELPLHLNVPDGPQLLAAMQALESMVSIWREAEWRLTPTQLQGTYDAFNLYISRTDGIDFLEIPKRHLALHLIREIAWFGNPRYYMVWTDESLNRKLKACCRQVHQHTFDRHVLRSMHQLTHERHIVE
jgi:hypothetical protein